MTNLKFRLIKSRLFPFKDVEKCFPRLHHHQFNFYYLVLSFQLPRYIAVPGNWGPWSDFGTCSATCGSGIRVRRRMCNNPPPIGGGDECPGRHVQRQHCRRPPCTGMFMNTVINYNNKGVWRYTPLSPLLAFLGVIYPWKL